MGLIRKLVSLRDQKGHDFGKVPFKRNQIYADFTGRATFIKKQTNKQEPKIMMVFLNHAKPSKMAVLLLDF